MSKPLAAGWQFATPPQLAKIIGTDQSKVLSWIHSGELVAIDITEKLGGRGRYRVARAEWEAFLERRKTTTRLKQERGIQAQTRKVPKPRKQYV